MTEKTHVYVDVAIADKIKSMGDESRQVDLIQEVFEQKRKDMKYDLECLEEDLLAFKLIVTKHKVALKEVYEQQSEQLEEMFNQVRLPSEGVREQYKVLKEDLDAGFSEIKGFATDMEKVMSKVSYSTLHNLEKVLELCERYQNLDNDTKKMFDQVIKKGE